MSAAGALAEQCGYHEHRLPPYWRNDLDAAQTGADFGARWCEREAGRARTRNTLTSVRPRRAPVNAELTLRFELLWMLNSGDAVVLSLISDGGAPSRRRSSRSASPYFSASGFGVGNVADRALWPGYSVSLSVSC